MENRELTVDDYLAMLRRRLKVILIPALLAPLAGFLVSFLFTAKYTSQSEVQVESPAISDTIVPQVYTLDLTQHMNEIWGRVKSPANLRSKVQTLGLAKQGQNLDDAVSDISDNSQVQAAPDIAQSTTTKKKGSAAAFYVSYTGSTADQARKVCEALTSMLIEQDLRARQEHSKETTDFLTQQVNDAQTHLNDLEKKLAAFKDQHMGQLPGDEDTNQKILMGLDTQLDANTQSLNRASQDKAYTESMLAQQLAAWKASQSASNPQTLQQQLQQLQTQLIDLEARYTEDHPDVIKAKADIANVKKRLAEINDTPAKPSDAAADKGGSGTEPAEVRDLRLRIHQYEDLIAQGTRDQKKLQQAIGVYQSRVAASPAVEEQYKELARDYDNAQKVYTDDLTKQSTSNMATQAANQAEGAQMAILQQASAPDTPSFPNRLLFAGGGLGAGLVLGLGLALWLELRDQSIRTQADAEAALELPMLVSVPWLVETAAPANGNGKGHFWKLNKQPEQEETPRY